MSRNAHAQSEHSPRIEKALTALWGAATPDSAFVADLEHRLLARKTALMERHVAGATTSHHQSMVFSRQRRWTMIGLGLLLVVALVLIAARPQRVWAEVQRLLGYVPGIGFVDLEETRVLATPVEVAHGGVTLRVDHVLAQPGGTTVVVRAIGLPTEDELWPNGGAAVDEDLDPGLRLPDGQRLSLEGCTLRLEMSTLEFPPLPDGVYHITLELPRLPLVPDGVAPADWEVPLMLRPATGELVAELFPKPYTPGDASDTEAGITLRVVEVAHSPEETAVRLAVEWADSDWELPRIGGREQPSLSDDLGHTYFRPAGPDSGSSSQTVAVLVQPDGGVAPPRTQGVLADEQTLSFAPVSLSARQMTLSVAEVGFDVQADTGFVMDLGDDPQVGDHWPLAVDLDVAGFRVHISGARLTEEEIVLHDGPSRRTLLEFDIDAVANQANRTLYGIRLDGGAAGFRSGSTWGYNDRSHALRSALEAKEGEGVPSGIVEVRVQGASIAVSGQWTIVWTPPGVDDTGGAPVAPIRYHPEGVSQTRNGLTLKLNEVVSSDRLTTLSISLNEPPPGVTLNKIQSWNPATGRHELILEDDRGHRYEPSWDTVWRLPGETGYDVGTLTFQPVHPSARRITLHVPAVDIVLPAAATFDVSVPGGLTMTMGSSDVPWMASEPWDVDIRLDVAGYQLAFTAARIQDLNGTTMLTLISEPHELQQSGRWLSGLRLASVTGPDRRAVDLETAYSAAGRVDVGSEMLQVVLAFDVTDPETNSLQPGRYHIDVDGVAVAVQGPWKFSWKPLGR
ncbi:MAG: hypothetical protein GX620_10955 [Chloroflexi bacterium]|nr:hypothetical protein [Chloroflexota bacterium]